MPDQERPHGDIASANQISMQGVPARGVLAHKAQPLLRAVLIGGVPTHRTLLRGVVGIHLDGKRSHKRGLVADEGL